MIHDFERSALDRVYVAGTNIAKELRELADRIDNAVQTAVKNEGTTETYRSTVEDLPGEIVKLVTWGLANAHLDAPSRMLSDLHQVRDAQREIAAKPIADDLRRFAAQWRKNPQNSDTIYSLMHMEDGQTVEDSLTAGLLDTTADLLDPKGA